jgi:hypothetical protein
MSWVPTDGREGGSANDERHCLSGHRAEPEALIER